VARTHDTIVGFCISSYDAGLIWLAWFGVLPAARGQGIGGRLLAALSQTMTVRRAHKIWCDTRTANDKAQRVLEAFGFREIAQLRNHWYGQDFLLWEWPPADPV
jgi:ribosomal protein S18 acetylase RimI-like enzyme